MPIWFRLFLVVWLWAHQYTSPVKWVCWYCGVSVTWDFWEEEEIKLWVSEMFGDAVRCCAGQGWGGMGWGREGRVSILTGGPVTTLLDPFPGSTKKEK